MHMWGYNPRCRVRFSAPGIANINGINLNGETGNISGTPTDVQSQLVVSVFLELKQSSEGYGRQGGCNFCCS